MAKDKQQTKLTCEKCGGYFIITENMEHLTDSKVHLFNSLHRHCETNPSKRKTDTEICDFIVNTVAEVTDIKRELFCSKIKGDNYAECRFMTMYLMQKYSTKSQVLMSEYFNGKNEERKKNRCAIVYAKKQIDKYLETRERSPLGYSKFIHKYFDECEKRTREFIYGAE